MPAVAAIQDCAAPGRTAREAGLQAAACARVIRKLRQAEKKSGYRVEALLDAARG